MVSEISHILESSGRTMSTGAIVDALRERVLSGPEGAFLGSEADLLAEYRVSRPTFRQIARVLEQEELLVVRRGVGGGYYSRHPSVEMVGTVSGNYLRSHHIIVADIFEVLNPLSDLLYEKAALSDDEVARDKLIDVRRRYIALLDHAPDIAASLSLARENAQILITMAKNPLLGLQMSVLDQLARNRMARSGDLPTSETVEQGIRLRIRLIDAILAHEEEVARSIGRLLISAVQNAGVLGTNDEL